MAKRRPECFYFGAGNGYVSFRYGRAMKVTLAENQPRRVERRLEVLPGKRREAITTAAVAILERWRSSKFEFEGACRHGVRAGLCLDGFSYGAADAWSEKIVCEALRRIGAVRPTWIEGQPEHAQDGYAPVERTICERCGKPLPDDARAGQRFCSAICRSSAMSMRARRLSKLLGKAEYDATIAASAEARRQASAMRKVRVCEQCGETFSSKRKSPRFCSLRCSAANQRKPLMRTCLHCGNDFEATKQPKLKYCGAACWSEARRKKVVVIEERACRRCGVVFLPTRSNKFFCSRNCGNLDSAKRRYHERRKAPPPPPATRVCGGCNATFLATRSNKFFCTKNCARNDRKKRKDAPAFICEAAE